MNCIKVGLVVLVVSLVWVVEGKGVGEGGCKVDETYAYVGFWRAYDPVTWCGGQVETTIVHSLGVWRITEKSGKLVRRYEENLDNNPEISLPMLEDDLAGRRVVLLCTHGSNPQWEGPGFAVEYYKSRMVAHPV